MDNPSDHDLSAMIALWHKGLVSQAEILDCAMTMIRRDHHAPKAVMTMLKMEGETFSGVIDDTVDLLSRPPRNVG